MKRPSVFFDNVDELRNEYDWMYEFMGRMAEHIRGDADVHSLADYVYKIEGDNAKLRQLVRHLMACGRNKDCDTCPYREEPCDFDHDARELGIEVD